MTGYTTQYLYRDTEFEQISGQDLSLVYTYTPEEQGKQIVWVTFEIAGLNWPLHRCENCLVTWPQTQGYQPTVKQLDLRDTLILQNPPVTARYFAFQYKDNNLTQLVLYWYESTVFTINDTSMQKNVKISLIAYPNSPEQVSNMEEQLLPFAKTIAEYWQPIKTWTTIAMTISKNGLLLATVSTGFLSALILLYFFENFGQRKANAAAYDKLSKPNQQVVNALLKTERESTPTLEKIQMTYKQTTNESVDTHQLEENLDGLEKTGVIGRSITNIQDEPTETWKTRMSLFGRRHPK
jgi:hypothetical protein